MTTTPYATYDGKVLRPDRPVPLAPNPRVRLSIEAAEPEPSDIASFLQTAQALNLDGPADWSTRLIGRVPLWRGHEGWRLRRSWTPRTRSRWPSPADQNHPRAVSLAQRIPTERTRLLTTRAVMLEIGKLP